MQPHLFPYLGYFQLVCHCNKFVFYDDVNFRKSGYINRNNILVNGIRHLFTLPVKQASSFKKINALEFSSRTEKLLRTMAQAYSNSPYVNDVMPLIETVLESDNRNVASMASDSVIKTLDFLGVKISISYSSELNYDRGLDASNKLYSICKIFGAQKYCNNIGGRQLYSKRKFLEEGLELGFIEMEYFEYYQGKSDFVSHLSMIDILMWNSKEKIRGFLERYRLS